MKRTLIAAVLAMAVGLPVGWIATFMATPLLWKLEPILHMELAGHSGPSDWVFLVGWGVMIPALFLLFRKTLLRHPQDCQ
jgi:ABC-type antimicrobial peptide transport system permease subunit